MKLSPGDVVKARVCAAAPVSSAVTATVYVVPEYGFAVEVHVVFASLSDPVSLEPSFRSP